MEERQPILGDGFFPRVHNAIGGRRTVFEDTIVAHKLHHTGDIMTVESLMERQDSAYSRFYSRHFHSDNASLPTSDMILSPTDQVVDGDCLSIGGCDLPVIVTKHLVDFRAYQPQIAGCHALHKRGKD